MNSGILSFLKRGVAVAAALLVLSVTQALSQMPDITVTSPAGEIPRGGTFTAKLVINPGFSTLGFYSISISYNDLMLEFVSIKNPQPIIEFDNPVASSSLFSDSIKVVGTNIVFPGCANSGPIEVAELIFKVLDHANPSLDTAITPVPNLIKDCNDEIITPSFMPPFSDGFVAILNPTQMTNGMGGYLDVNGDGIFNQADAQEIEQIVNEQKANTTNPYINAGGLQGDINGNGVVDSYDVGYMYGLTRPIQFIQSGLNGNVETTAEGDDTQRVPVGPAPPRTVCIEAGQNGVIDTLPLGDDFMEEKALNTTDLLDDHNTPGAPAELELVWPPTTTFTVNPINEVGIFDPISIIVRVKDKNGTPRLGISPSFDVIAGSGFFDVGGGATMTNVEGFPTDSSAMLGGAATGLVAVTYMPGIGASTVQISLPSDPTRGAINPINPIIINFVASATIAAVPDGLTVIAPESVSVGQEGAITLNVGSASGGVGGFAGKLFLTTDRNLDAGNPGGVLGMGDLQMIAMDKFETGDFSGGPFMNPWQVDVGGGSIVVDSSGPQIFGSASVHAIGSTSAPLEHVLTVSVDTTFFRDIRLNFAWSYLADGFGDYLIIEYSQDGITFNTLNMITGPELAAFNFLGNVSKLDLSAIAGVRDNPNLKIRFRIFLNQDSDNMTLDNILIAGRQILSEDDLESETVGNFPSSFDPASRVETGEDGIADTAVLGDDNQVIPLGQGKPFADAIFPGPDNTLNSTLGGDDEFSSFNTIDTGLNGINETTAAGDDFLFIPLGDGQKYAVIITPGPDGKLDTATALGDDMVREDQGQDPDIVVDNKIGNNPGPNQGNRNSANFIKIGRSSLGSGLERYSLMKVVDLSGLDDVHLNFYSQTLGMNDTAPPGAPKQSFMVEVSDNGGWNYYRVMVLSGIEETQWTLHDIKLSGDDRFQLTDGFIIRWTATMDSTETDPTDPDAVYIDDIEVKGVIPPPDTFGPISDEGGGLYRTTISSLEPGMTSITAYLLSLDGTILPLFGNAPVPTNITFRKAVQGSIQVIPDTFVINSCETLQFMVVGRYVDTPPQQLENMTSLFRLIAYGPASFDEKGLMTARCFRPGENLSIKVEAWPRVPGLYDPGGGGGGQQTGYIDGKSMESFHPFDGILDSSITVEGASNLSDTTESDGSYFKAGVPVGTYTVKAIKQGYVLDSVSGVVVVDGETTTANLFQVSGSDTDGDTVNDSVDNDDDDDGVTDTDEGIQGTSQYDPDHDDDGYQDGVDAFPTDPNEWIDTDGDTTGDNADTDDDGDTILDTEEEEPGADGYITDPLLVDTDGDTLSDPDEINTHLTNPSNADTDGGGRNDGDEIGMARDPNDASDDNTVPAANAGPNQTVDEHNSVGLDASSTTDADADSFTYSWTQVAGPASMSITNPTTALPTFEATFEGTYTFRLVADDSIGWGQDWIVVTVNNVSDALPCGPGTGNYVGVYCYGDTNGDGTVDIIDINTTKNESLLKPADFTGVYPSNGDTVDLDGTGSVDLVDVNIVRAWSLLKTHTSAADGTPAFVNLITGTPITIPVGTTATITVEVRSDATNNQPRAGVGVVFQLQSGSATLFGGEGDASAIPDPDNGGNYPAGSRWATTNDAASGGQASIKVRADASGTIVIRARVPSRTVKQHSTQIYLDITIN